MKVSWQRNRKRWQRNLATKLNPLSQKLLKKAQNIGELLKEYVELRYGDVDFRYGDEKWRVTNGKEGTPPGESGIPPKIVVVSTPRNIYLPYETPKNNPNIEKNQTAVNPLFKALQDMKELNEEEVSTLQLDNRFGILQDLGVTERLNCSALFPWIRKLASQITYILETRELYSLEVKAVYPEILNDLEIARSVCDQLTYTLSKQNGILTNRQYTELMTKLLHYAKIAQQAALQLSDHHEAFVTEAISPLESGPEIEWVFKEEFPPKPPKEEKPKEE